MRTNIDIDDKLLATAMRAGSFPTKKETVDAGLRLLARQAAYREILKWKGKLKWEGGESIDWTQPAGDDEIGISPWPLTVQEPRSHYGASKVSATAPRKSALTKAAAPISGRKKQAARHASG
jgi:hypothetical protein